MNITIVCDVLGKENNGTTVAAMNLIRHLKSAGHKVTILCGDQDKKGEENYYVVPNLSFGKLLDKYVEKVGVTLAKPDKEVIKKAVISADLVHVMVPLGLGIATIKVMKELGLTTPITAGFHMQAENLTSHFKMNKFKLINHKVYRFIYKYFYKYVDGVHYPTEFIKNTFEINLKKDVVPPKAYVISNGVNEQVKKQNVEKPEELKDKIVVLTIGRFGREKSQDTLIKAISKSKYKNKIQLILAGLGPNEKKYKKLSKNLPIQPKFEFLSREEIVDVINYSDIYVHPADIELEGIACLEAIACGKFTIVSNSKLSATKNFAIDEKCMFEKRNANDLARVLDYWIENEDERKEYANKYLESAKDFNQKKCMQRMEQMMLELIEKDRRENNKVPKDEEIKTQKTIKTSKTTNKNTKPTTNKKVAKNK